MRRIKTGPLYRLVSLFMALAALTSSLTMTRAKYVWSKDDNWFYISYSEDVHSSLPSSLPSGYYAFYIVGGAGASNGGGAGKAGDGGTAQGVVWVAPGSTLSFGAGAGGGRPNGGASGMGSSRGGNGSSSSNGGGGGGCSILKVGSTTVAIAGGGGGASDDGGGLNTAKNGGSGGHVTYSTSGGIAVGQDALQNGSAHNLCGKGGKATAGGDGGAGAGLNTAGNSGGGVNLNGASGGDRANTGQGVGGGGAGYTGGGSGAHGFLLDDDGSGGGGSSYLNIGTGNGQVVSAVPSDIPDWNPSGSAGTNSNANGAAGKGYFYYLGPTLPAKLPGAAYNF